MRRWRLSTLVAAGLFLAPLAAVVYGEDAVGELRQLCQQIEKARTKVRYQAEQTVYAFSAKRTLVARFLVQYAYPYRRRECIEGPAKQRFVLLEDGKFLWSFFPARRIVVKEPLREEDSPFPLGSPQDVELLARNYDLTIRGPVPSGNVRCRILEFVPKWNDRPRREFWLEQQWNVPVRIHVFEPRGRPSYMTELRKIVWNPHFDPGTFRLKVPEDTKLYEVTEKRNLTLEEARRLWQSPVLLPRTIPKGYVSHDIVYRVEGDTRCLQIIYTDGLSSFSFFQERTFRKIPGPPAALRLPSAGSLPMAFTRQYGLINVVSLAGVGRRTIVVGDVHQDRLMEIAESGAEPGPRP